METKITVDDELVKAGRSVFKILYESANGDTVTMVNKMVTGDGPNKEKAFSLLLGFSQTGLLAIEDLVRALDKVPTAERERGSLLVKSYMLSDPGDSECVTLMDAIKDKYPELLSDVIAGKRNWKLADIRRHLLKYAFTEQLWLKLATMEEDLKSRK